MELNQNDNIVRSGTWGGEEKDKEEKKDLKVWERRNRYSTDAGKEEVGKLRKRLAREYENDRMVKIRDQLKKDLKEEGDRVDHDLRNLIERENSLWNRKKARSLVTRGDVEEEEEEDVEEEDMEEEEDTYGLERRRTGKMGYEMQVRSEKSWEKGEAIRRESAALHAKRWRS